MFESIQEPLAFYRLHGRNLSTLNKEREIEEVEMWLKENTSNLNDLQMKKLQKIVNYRKFVNCKIDGKYRECIDMLLNSKVNLFNIKNLIVFLTPVILLRKLLWYHQNYNELK